MNNKHSIHVTETQAAIIDDALRNYFDAHFNPETEKQECAELLNDLINLRIEIAQSLPCSHCGKPRMGFHSDLCPEHYAQLTRGELREPVYA